MSFVQGCRIVFLTHTTNIDLTTDIGSEKNKTGNIGLATDSFDTDHHCNRQERGWIRHHPDVDVLVWWWDVGQAQFPRISVMVRQFLSIPATS